jgi:predicted amidohydrolase YtcJ
VSSSNQTPGPAPLVVVNARIASGDPRQPWCDAAIVVRDSLVFLGRSAEAMKRAPAGAQVVDARRAEVAADAHALQAFAAVRAADE